MAIINGIGRVGIRNFTSTSPTQSYLLDTYGGAAVGYSLRKLSSTYTGSAIRVRRSSDNTEQNIGFDGSGNLDTASLLTFVGAGNGFVTTWYNQSGNNNNLVQTTASAQPQIVLAGSFITKSGKPSIKWSTVQTMVLTTNLTGLQNTSFSFFMDYYKSTSGSNSPLLFNGGNYAWYDGNTIQYIATSSVTATITSLSHKIINIILVNGVSTKIYSNSNQLGTTGNGSNSNPLTINGLFTTVDSRVETYCSEFIFYNSNQTTNRLGIETNQNNYYSIY